MKKNSICIIIYVILEIMHIISSKFLGYYGYLMGFGNEIDLIFDPFSVINNYQNYILPVLNIGICLYMIYNSIKSFNEINLNEFKSLFIAILIILFINLLLTFVTLIDKVVSYVIIHRNLNLLVIVAIFYFLKKNIVGSSVKKKNDYSI